MSEIRCMVSELSALFKRETRQKWSAAVEQKVSDDKRQKWSSASEQEVTSQYEDQGNVMDTFEKTDSSAAETYADKTKTPTPRNVGENRHLD